MRKNLLITASAGSGKTYQLANRMIGLIALGADPASLVALTFTRKAAGEISDRVFSRLASAVAEPHTAAAIEAELGLPETNFPAALEALVAAMPKLNFGTMDGFFLRILQQFPYELGLASGSLDLIQGPSAKLAIDQLINELLSGHAEIDDGFLASFRAARQSNDSVLVSADLRNFVGEWHDEFMESGEHLDWGPANLSAHAVEMWEEQKDELIAQARADFGREQLSHKSQELAVKKMLEELSEHQIGGPTSKFSGIFQKLSAAMVGADPIEISHYKPLLLRQSSASLRALVRLLADCEFAFLLSRTRAVRHLIGSFDRLHDERLRSRGKLGFSDIKRLMGNWTSSEMARLSRELIDHRLDARYEHWLLDEFQDTSLAEWRGLSPLIDEAASDSEGHSLFVVGDAKQAIYAWRGGAASLLAEVRQRYEGYGLEVASLAMSYRSCPQVLSLVNQVFGDPRGLREVWGEAVADAWEWDEHVAAPSLATTEKRGEARVEFVREDEEGSRVEARMIELMRELQVGQREMTCAVLVRANKDVREIATILRGEGFDVIEEGVRRPSQDGQIGIVLTALLRWLADPNDTLALGLVRFSPLHSRFTAAAEEISRAEPAPPGAANPPAETSDFRIVNRVWSDWMDVIHREGYAVLIGRLRADFGSELSPFGSRQFEDIVIALREFDGAGGGAPGAAWEFLEGLEIQTTPGLAEVQVMTIHRSKGLGFDIVFLPRLEDIEIPKVSRFKRARSEKWITEAPVAWIRALQPPLKAAEDIWASAQRLEELCLLYVAMTRAKRGLYLLLHQKKEPKQSKKPQADERERTSVVNFIRLAICPAGTNETEDEFLAFQDGRPDWVQLLDLLPAADDDSSPPPLRLVQPRMPVTGSLDVPARPSARATRVRPAFSATAAARGSGFHHEIARIRWLDEPNPASPKPGRSVRSLLEIPAISDLLTRNGRRITLHIERTIDAIVDAEWHTGIADRLHLHRNSEGQVTRVELIDFKTDRGADAAELRRRHRAQFSQYRRMLGNVFPGVPIDCLLVAVANGEVVGMNDE